MKIERSAFFSDTRYNHDLNILYVNSGQNVYHVD